MSETGASPLPSTPPARSPLFRAEQFVWLTARVLEQRLFAYHFLHGTPDAVEAALDAYRNEDGGYGYGLEPDLRGPVSQPLHTAHALRVLDAVGRCGGQRVERVCRYLTSVSTTDGALPAVRPSQRGYPTAPFVPVVDDPASELLATGPVVGLLHRNEVWHAWLFRATDFCWQSVESLDKSHPYEVEAAVAFLDSVPDRSRAEAAADRLGRMVREQRLAALDPDRLDAYPVASGYAPGEHHFPHDFARSPESLARAWFTDDEMARSLDHLAAEQQDDGGWPVLPHCPNRGWYPQREWAPAPALESRPLVTIEALRTLRAYGRFVG
ncbi:hypothetical protein [Streptomyces alanosinicus]|uniref:Prenyltransferase n=1 Tax=Streptomyces alanosinicus TaxID=68171 RepID=A0A919D3B8_9ACTN|nr:hypothetical protein [Streptomyces alanosinicus]GHE06900.1 hypothetical protein GCM10010339_50060 [Streptomyces alanosinicus]